MVFAKLASNDQHNIHTLERNARPAIRFLSFYNQSKSIFQRNSPLYIGGTCAVDLGVGTTSSVGLEPLYERFAGCSYIMIRAFQSYLTKKDHRLSLRGLDLDKESNLLFLPVEQVPGFIIGFCVFGPEDIFYVMMKRYRDMSDACVYLTYNSNKKDALFPTMEQAIAKVRQGVYLPFEYNIVYKPQS